MQIITARCALTLSLMAALPATAAMHVSSDGEGQVLLFPYYTVNQENSTLVSLVNHTDEVKALKLRFREAMNGRDVLDVNLYLGPHAGWGAALVADDSTGPARLFTKDAACTVPRIPVEGLAFRNNFYVGSQQDDGPDSLDRTREGFFEAIEMGVVVDEGDMAGPQFPLPDAPGNFAGVDNNPGSGARKFASDATAVNGVPPSCINLAAAWAGGIWASTPEVDIDEPTGGISGLSVIVDVQAGVSFSQRAEAIEGFYTVANSGALHTDPGAVLPNLASARTRIQGAVEAASGDGGILRWNPGTPNAVSSLLMHERVFNHFDIGASLLAKSEWVLTFPTKHLHIEGVGANRVSRRPFTDNVDDLENPGIPGNVPDVSVFDPAGSCEPISRQAWEDSGESIVPGTCWEGDEACEARQLADLCYQINVVAFNQDDDIVAGGTAVLGARVISRNLELPSDSGQAALILGDEDNFMIADPGVASDIPRDRLFGLPTLGFWVARFINANAEPGILASYAVTAPHVWRGRRDRVLVIDEAAPILAPLPEP